MCSYDPLSSELSDWLPAIVTGQSGDRLFVVVLKLGFSASITDELKGDVKLGLFLDVRVRRNEPEFRKFKAQHTVVELRVSKLSDTFPVRVVTMNKSIAPTVLIAACARPYGTSQFNDKKILLFENETFGTILDLARCVPTNIDQSASASFFQLEFKCIGSPKDRSKSIFVVTRLLYTPHKSTIAPSNPVNQLSPVYFKGTGCIVHSGRDKSFVWSDAHDQDIGLDPRFIPDDDKDILGKWCTFSALYYEGAPRARIIEMIKIVPDKIPTRLCRGREVEMYVECTFNHDVEDGRVVLRHPLLGRVKALNTIRSDAERILAGSVGSHWVKRYYNERSNDTCRWVLGNLQCGPDETTSENSSCYYGNLENSDDGQYSDDSVAKDAEIEDDVLQDIESLQVSDCNRSFSSLDDTNLLSKYEGKSEREMVGVLMENTELMKCLIDTDPDAYVHLVHLLKTT